MSIDKVKQRENISNRIKQARIEKGLGQVKLAEMIGVSNGSIGNWETGTRPPGAENVKKIADALGVSIPWLLYGDEKPQSKGQSGRSSDDFAIQCREYFEEFLATCDTPVRQAWFLQQLILEFPLSRFQREDQPLECPENQKPLTEGQRIDLGASRKYDLENHESAVRNDEGPVNSSRHREPEQSPQKIPMPKILGELGRKPKAC